MTKIPYKAPDFSLPNSSGETISPALYKGKWLVVFFYPKDYTPGCTIEACSLRDVYDTLKARNVEVIGISKDGAKSHGNFAKLHDLKYQLLTDATGKVAEAYGATHRSLLSKSGGVARKTFIIDPEGDVRKVYDKVTPTGHGKQLLKDIDELQFEAGSYGAGNFSAS